MIYARILLILFLVLLAIYWTMLLLQLFGAIKFTKKEITFKGIIIPFYYWFYTYNY